MPTCSIAATTRVLSSALLAFLSWARRPSAICQPTVKTGLRAVEGSWKTIATSDPRMARSCSAETLSTFLPEMTTAPDRCAVSGSRPRMDRAVTVLPDPDSPTMASTSPGETDSETSLTACTSPPSVEKVTSRPSTSRMLPVAEAAESCVCLLMP